MDNQQKCYHFINSFHYKKQQENYKITKQKQINFNKIISQKSDLLQNYKGLQQMSIKLPLQHKHQKHKQKKTDLNISSNTNQQNSTSKYQQQKNIVLNTNVNAKAKQTIQKDIKNGISVSKNAELNVQVIESKQKVQKTGPQLPGVIQPIVQQVTKGSKKKKKSIMPVIQLTAQQQYSQKSNYSYNHFIQHHSHTQCQSYPQLNILLKQSLLPIYYPEQNQIFMNMLIRNKKFREKRIYYGVLQDNQSFSQHIFNEQVQGQARKQQVRKLFHNIHFLLLDEIQQGDYQIKNKEKASKDQIIYGSYKANQIRMAQSIIKDKLSNLNDQLTLEVSNPDESRYQQQKFRPHKKFDLHSTQTKKAQQFVKKLQEQERLRRQRVQSLKQQQKQIMIYQTKQKQQLQAILQSQKLKQRRQRIQAHAISRQNQKQKRESQHKKFTQYLSQRRQLTPLYKKNQQDFKAYMIKQHMRKLQIMSQLRKHKRSVSKEEVEIHMQKYKELKMLMDEEKKELRQQAKDDMEETKTYFQGKFFQTIANQVHPKTIIQQKRNKMDQLYTKKLQYATQIKKKFKPKIDPDKKQQLQKLITENAPKRKDDKLLAQKIKIQGHRNLQKLHKIVQQMRANGKIVKNENILERQQVPKQRYINYLNQLKTNRMQVSSSSNKSRYNSLDLSKLQKRDISHSQMGSIQMKVMNLERMADRKSIFLRHNQHLDIDHYMQNKFQLEDHYLESAKGKVQLINKYRAQ